jgi:hypothetical protein
VVRTVVSGSTAAGLSQLKIQEEIFCGTRIEKLGDMVNEEPDDDDDDYIEN